MVKKHKYGRFPPFSLRLSFDERAQLEASAGSMSLGAYIREKLLSAPAERQYRKKPVTEDRQALAQLLAALGAANLSRNLEILARAADSGSLMVTPDTERALREAYTEIMWMRRTLVSALGYDKPRRGRSKT